MQLSRETQHSTAYANSRSNSGIPWLQRKGCAVVRALAKLLGCPEKGAKMGSRGGAQRFRRKPAAYALERYAFSHRGNTRFCHQLALEPP